MGVQPFPKIQSISAGDNGMVHAVSGLVREFFDMLGDGEAGFTDGVSLVKPVLRSTRQVPMQRVVKLVSAVLNPSHAQWS